VRQVRVSNYEERRNLWTFRAWEHPTCEAVYSPYFKYWVTTRNSFVDKGARRTDDDPELLGSQEVWKSEETSWKGGMLPMLVEELPCFSLVCRDVAQEVPTQRQDVVCLCFLCQTLILGTRRG
jgi:hypothetical protein